MVAAVKFLMTAFSFIPGEARRGKSFRMGNPTLWKMRRQAEGLPRAVLCYHEIRCSTANPCGLIISLWQEGANLRPTMRRK